MKLAEAQRDAKTTRARFLTELMSLPIATEVEVAEWEPWQLDFLNDEATIGIDNKSRQVGWSWICAAEAVADCHIEKGNTSVMVSFNREEAKEKIRYAHAIAEAVHPDYRISVDDADTKTAIEFKNGSRILSHPCRPVRGKPRAKIYLDEFGWYPHARQVYLGSLPAMSRGGRTRIGSSPAGRGGMFWEIFSQELNEFPEIKRRTTLPWWVSRALCVDVPHGLSQAPAMETEDRVKKFGTPQLQVIFGSMLLEDFQQEFECAFAADDQSWIPWELIKDAQVLEDEDYRLVAGRGDRLDPVQEGLDWLFSHPEFGPLYWGFDVGRTKDLTEVAVLSKVGERLALRLGISLNNVKLHTQEELLLPLAKYQRCILGLIDQNGIGRQIAESLNARAGDRAQGVDFTSDSKELWAVNTKTAFEKKRTMLPPSRDWAYQIHSVKKVRGEGKFVKFDVEKSAKHHADKFWALALAITAASEVVVVRKFWPGGSAGRPQQ